MEIASVEVAGQARPFTVDHDNEALHIELSEAGQVEVVIAFSGKITDNMTGFTLLITQLMESRRKYCLLNLRAILRAKPSHVWMSQKPKQLFDLSLRFDQAEGELALSNMPEIDVENRKGTGI